MSSPFATIPGQDLLAVLLQDSLPKVPNLLGEHFFYLDCSVRRNNQHKRCVSGIDRLTSLVQAGKRRRSKSAPSARLLHIFLCLETLLPLLFELLLELRKL